MQFTLNGWPPYLSHLVFFLLGMCMANFMFSSREQVVSYRSFLLSYPLSQNFISHNSLSELNVGDKVSLVKQSDDGSACAFKLSPIILLQKNPFVVLGVSVSELGKFSTAIQNRHRKKFSLLANHKIPNVKFCSQKSRIEYASPAS